jgi:hypothetical protein
VPELSKHGVSGREKEPLLLDRLPDARTRGFQEAARRVHAGDIGRPAFAQVFYYAGRPVKDKRTSGMGLGQRCILFSDLCVRVFGIKGCTDTHYGGLVRITGENAWQGTDHDDTFQQWAINNVKAFVASIRDGKPINNADQSVESNLTAILGRTAAYQQRLVTWEAMLQSTERLHVDLKLKW